MGLHQIGNRYGELVICVFPKEFTAAKGKTVSKGKNFVFFKRMLASSFFFLKFMILFDFFCKFEIVFRFVLAADSLEAII